VHGSETYEDFKNERRFQKEKQGNCNLSYLYGRLSGGHDGNPKEEAKRRKKQL